MSKTSRIGTENRTSIVPESIAYLDTESGIMNDSIFKEGDNSDVYRVNDSEVTKTDLL